MKAAFIQNVSHEVRTPLNIISGFAQVLADPTLKSTPEQRKLMAQTMMHNTRLITRLVDEMLELSFNETTGTAPKDDSVEVNQLLKELADEVKNELKSGVELTVDSSLANDYTLVTNRAVLKGILQALVDNAMKYTEKGAITLTAQATDHMLTLAVEDSGCGIPAEQADHIFDRFVKLDNFKEGLGLGLPLCRVMAQRLGANVVLDTAYTAPKELKGGTGARFVVDVPL